MTVQNNMFPTDENNLGSAASEIRQLLVQSRRKAAVQVNGSFWLPVLVEHELEQWRSIKEEENE